MRGSGNSVARELSNEVHEVKIGSEATEVTVVTAEEITAKTPVGSGAPEVIVTDDGGSSTGGPHYTYVAPPTVVTM